MVGVGGRSKACTTCYRRRVKCDESRPHCKRCIKANLDCGGYKPMTIIQYGKAQEHSLTHPPLPADPHLHSHWSTKTGEVPEALRTARLELGYEVPPAVDSIFINYTLSNLLSARNQQHVITGVERDLSDLSFLALATFFFGNEHKERRLIEYGLQRYGKVLKKLNLALGDAKRRQTFDVLEAVVLMAMFEYLMSERPDGWIAHSLGLERLFDARGPQSFVPRAERTILERSRLSIIFAHLVLRKPTILARLDWQSIPWGSDPSHKHLIEHLVDIMACCPQLLTLEDKMKAAKDEATKNTHTQSLWKQAGRLKEQLQDWKRHWNVSEPDCRYEVPVETNNNQDTTRDKSDAHPLHLFKYVYNSLHQANAVTLYNATQILIGGMLRSSGTTADLIDAQWSIDHNAQQLDAAIDIARSADHCIQIARGGLGSFYILFPLRMAWAVGYRLDPLIKSTTETMLHRIQFGEAGHWAIAGYILGI